MGKVTDEYTSKSIPDEEGTNKRRTSGEDVTKKRIYYGILPQENGA